MNNRVNYLIKNMGLLTISNFSSKILVFLLVPLYTNILTTSEYGTYELIVSTISLIYPILTLNIVDAVMRFSMDKEYDKKKVAAIGFKYVSISFFIVFFFIVIIQNFKIWESLSDLTLYIVLYYVSYVLNQYFIQLSKGMEHVSDMAIAGVISTLIMICANLLFLLVFKWGLIGFLLANILSQIFPAIYFMIRLKFWTLLDFLSDKKLEKEMFIYCIPLIATVIGWWVNSASDKYIVSFICGVSANGILSVAYKIPQIINTLQGIFTQAWQISAIKEYGEEDTASFYGTTFSLINLMMCLSCMILIILSRPLAIILYAKDFYIAWKYVPFLLISSVMNCASGLLGPILSAQKNSKAMAISAFVGASVNIVLNIILVYVIGVQGATIATLVSSIIIYFIRKKAVDNDMKINKYMTVLITWLLLCAQACVEAYLKMWAIEIIIMVTICIINKDLLKELIYKLKLVTTGIKRKISNER